MASAKRRRAASDVDAGTSEALSTTSSATRVLATIRSRRTRRQPAAGDVGSDFVPSDGDNEYENDECENEEMPPERNLVQADEKKKQPKRSPGDHLRKVAAAVPCHGDYGCTRTYYDAHENRSRLAAYVGFNDIASMHSYILSAAFLPAYVIFKDTGLVWFRKLVTTLQDPTRRDDREENMSDLFLTLERRRANGDDKADKLGDALQWLVHRSAEVKNWSQEQQDSALANAYKALSNRYPGVAAAIPRTYLGPESALPLWQHPQDPQPDVEQYHRALQLLRYCERPERIGRQKRKTDKWTNFWQGGDVLTSMSVSSILIPPWMREQSDGRETVASTEQDREEHLSLNQAGTNAQPHEQAEGHETMGGSEEGQPLERISRNEATEQGFRLEGSIRGGDSTRPIEILDSDEDNEQDHQAKTESNAEDETSPIAIVHGDNSERYRQVKGEIEVEDYTAPIESSHEDNQALHRTACNILYVTSRKFSRFRCSNKKWFDECWEQMEYLDGPINNKAASTDPRDWSTSEEWRDAVRTELRLGTHWRRGADEGLALKLTSLRLQADGEKLDCYDCKAEQFSSSPKQIWEFVEKHQHCELEYCIDFFTEEEMADGKANDLETLEPSL